MKEKQKAIEFLEYMKETIKETVITADHNDLKSVDLCIDLIKSAPDPEVSEPERGTVRQLHKTLSVLISEGVGDQQIKAWDPNDEKYMPVTSATYQQGEPVQLWTDDID